MTKKTGFDADDLSTVEAANEGRILKVVNSRIPERPETGIEITLRGQDSAEYRRVYHEYQNKRIKAMTATGGKTGVTSEGADMEELEKLLACSIGWRTRVRGDDGEFTEEFVDTITLKGEEMKFNYENAKRLYKRVPMIYDQVRDFVNDRSNFLKG